MSNHMNGAHYQGWATPDDLFDALVRRFGEFDLDVSASAWSAKVPLYFDEQADGLAQPWHGRCFLNPPFKQMARWLGKALEECHLRGVETIAIGKSATDAAWWHDLAAQGEVYMLRGRPQFDAPPGEVNLQRNAYPIVVIRLAPDVLPGFYLWRWKDMAV
jgi:phage N-6-adenine-methyltransferase